MGLRPAQATGHRPQGTGHGPRAKGQGGIDVPVPSAGGDGNGGPAEAHRHRQDRACLDRDHPGAYQEHSESLCILDPSPPEGNQVTGMRRRRSPVGLGRRTVSTPSSGSSLLCVGRSARSLSRARSFTGKTELPRGRA